MDTDMELEGEETPVKELSEPDTGDAASEDTDDVLCQLFRILRPLCRSVNIVCERKVCNFDKSEFLRIYNPLSDKYYRYFPALQLIIFISDGTLGLRIFLEHKKVFKESFISNIEEKLSNPEEYLGIVTVLSAFLSELSVTKYDLCRGAFEESTFDGDLSTVDINSVLIENEDSRIIYRSRKCYLLVREGTQCNSCAELKNTSSVSCLKKEETTIIEETEEQNPETLHNGNLDRFLEVSMEESWRPAGRPRVESSALALVRDLKMPKMSYKKLIFSALMDSPGRKLKLTEIYDWILERYPGFRANKNGFQNSIRHNLSLNKMFVKEGGVSEAGRGGYWTVDPQYLSSSDQLETEQCGRPKIQPSNPINMENREVTPGIPSLDVNSDRDGITTKRLKIEGIASKIQAKVASSLEAEGDPLQVSHPDPGRSVFLSSRTSQEECSDQEPRMSGIKQEGADVIEPQVTISSVSSIKIPDAECDLILAGKHFLYNHLSDKLKRILPKPTNAETNHVSQSHQSNRQVPQISDPYQQLKPAHCFENDGVEISEYSKPCFSYKELIMLAIFSDPSGAICLNDIYLTIRKWFPYFRQRSIGLTWQNSIRHNLSLNKCFWRLDNNGTLTKVCLEEIHSNFQMFILKVNIFLLQGGSWSFDTADDTWRKLMSDKKKWTHSKRFQKTFLYELCELLSVRSEDFARHIFPVLAELCPAFYEEQEHSQDPLQLNVKHEVVSS